MNKPLKISLFVYCICLAANPVFGVDKINPPTPPFFNNIHPLPPTNQNPEPICYQYFIKDRDEQYHDLISDCQPLDNDTINCGQLKIKCDTSFPYSSVPEPSISSFIFGMVCIGLINVPRRTIK